jgi:hypothetical protein
MKMSKFIPPKTAPFQANLSSQYAIYAASEKRPWRASVPDQA